jgi:hypothetical protein
MRYFLRLFFALFFLSGNLSGIDKKENSKIFSRRMGLTNDNNDGAKICGMPNQVCCCFGALCFAMIILLSEHLNRNIVETLLSRSQVKLKAYNNNLYSPTHIMNPCVLNGKQVWHTSTDSKWTYLQRYQNQFEQPNTVNFPTIDWNINV